VQSQDNIAYKQYAKIDSEGITLRTAWAGYAGSGIQAMLRPGNIGRKRSEGEKGKPADKPGSVKALRPTTAIPLGRGLLHGSSHLPASSAGHVIACLFGVAPGAGCLAVRLTAAAVRSYRTVSPLPDPALWASCVSAPTHFYETLPPCGGKARSSGHRRSRLCGPVARLAAGGD